MTSHADKKAAREALAWRVALRTETFGTAEISVGAKISYRLAERIVKEWVKEGSVQPLEGPQNKRNMFRPDRDFVRNSEQRKRSPEENMWLAMRKLRVFDPTTIAVHASIEVAPVDTARAQTYCRGLLSVGYLRVVRKAVPSIQREARYSLAKDTGPFAPIERRVAAIVDPNTGQTLVIGGAK